MSVFIVQVFMGNKWIDVRSRTSLEKARGDAWDISIHSSLAEKTKGQYQGLARVVVRPKDVVIVRYGQKE